MGWTLVVDFGTTATSAVPVEGTEVGASTRVPSAVRREEDGGLAVGAAADRSGWAPETIDRTPKRSLGHAEHVTLGDTAVPVVDAVAAVLRAAQAEGTRTRGLPPSAAVLTHPVPWTEGRRTALLDAATLAGLPAAHLLPEPVAVATRHDDLAVDDLLAVYDLGGTFTTAVLRRTASGFAVLAHGAGELGGEHLDDLLVAHVSRHVARVAPDVWARLRAGATETWRRRGVELRRGVRTAKESLSRNKRHIVHVSAAECDVAITRAELEEMLEPSLAATVDELMATVARAGVTPDRIARYVLVGGGSRIPLVSRLVTGATGVAPVVEDDPERAVVLGAARAVVLGWAPATAAATPSPVDGAVSAPAVLDPGERLVVQASGATGGAAPPVTIGPDAKQPVHAALGLPTAPDAEQSAHLAQGLPTEPGAEQPAHPALGLTTEPTAPQPTAHPADQPAHSPLGQPTQPTAHPDQPAPPDDSEPADLSGATGQAVTTRQAVEAEGVAAERAGAGQAVAEDVLNGAEPVADETGVAAEQDEERAAAPQAGAVDGTAATPPSASAAPSRAKPAWRRRAVMLPVGAAAAAAVAAAATVAFQDGVPNRIVDAVSASSARPTPSRATAAEPARSTLAAVTTAPTPDAEPPSGPVTATSGQASSADAPNRPSPSLTINGPDQVAVGEDEHYTASYTHRELVANCRWTDPTGKVVPGCGWLPLTFPAAATYTVRFTVLQTTGQTHTVTKTITAG